MNASRKNQIRQQKLIKNRFHENNFAIKACRILKDCTLVMSFYQVFLSVQFFVAKLESCRSGKVYHILDVKRTRKSFVMFRVKMRQRKTNINAAVKFRRKRIRIKRKLVAFMPQSIWSNY